MKPIYLDYNATTPVDPRVVDVLLPYLTSNIGNAGSIDHYYGNQAQQAVERARRQVATLIGAEPEEIIFTSGATESNNIAVLGTLARAAEDAELIVSAIEHPAILEPAARLAGRIHVVPVTSDGIVDPDEVKKRITSKTALVSVMIANNETGVLQPISEIGAICAESGVPFHSDAVQATARIPIDVDGNNVGLLSLSAHKMYGPKGVGALFTRKRGQRLKLAPLHYGGGQERNLRPGTANVPGIVGLGAAAELARGERKQDAARESDLKDQLIAALGDAGDVTLNAPVASSLPQTINARIAGVGARALMHATGDELAFSSGSACATTKVEPSHVLLAQGLSSSEAAESVRLSFGRFTTDDEIERAGRVLVDAIERLRRISQAA